MARQGSKGDPLLELIKSNVKQASGIARHIGADPGAGDHLAVAVNQTERMRPSGRTGHNQPSPCQNIDVELQGLLLQAYALPGSRQSLAPFSSGLNPMPNKAERRGACSKLAATARLGRNVAFLPTAISHDFPPDRRHDGSPPLNSGASVRRHHGGVSQLSQSHNCDQKPAFPRLLCSVVTL